MKDQQSLIQGSKYGTYKIAPRLTTESLEAQIIEDRDINKKAVENEKKLLAEREARKKDFIEEKSTGAYGTNPGDRLFE